MKLIALALLSSKVFAAGGGGHLSDLAIPAGNFLIIFAFLFWKLKAPLRRMFDENSVKVKELVELAEEKDKQAQIKLDMYAQKVKDSSKEIERVMNSAKDDASNFEKAYKEEITTTMGKMTSDANARLESEKNNILKNLNSSLIDEVISKAKSKIEGDSSLNKKTTSNLISNL